MTIRVICDGERARVYWPENGVGYDQHVDGIGWVVDDQPSPQIEALARAIIEELKLRQGRTDLQLGATWPKCGECGGDLEEDVGRGRMYCPRQCRPAGWLEVEAGEESEPATEPRPANPHRLPRNQNNLPGSAAGL